MSDCGIELGIFVGREMGVDGGMVIGIGVGIDIFVRIDFGLGISVLGNKELEKSFVKVGCWMVFGGLFGR